MNENEAKVIETFLKSNKVIDDWNEYYFDVQNEINLTSDEYNSICCQLNKKGIIDEEDDNGFFISVQGKMKYKEYLNNKEKADEKNKLELKKLDYETTPSWKKLEVYGPLIISLIALIVSIIALFK